MRRSSADTAQLSLPLEMSGSHVALGSTNEDDLALLTRVRRRPIPMAASSADGQQRIPVSRSDGRLFLSVIGGADSGEVSHQRFRVPVKTGTTEVRSTVTDSVGSLPQIEADRASRRMAHAFEQAAQEIFENGTESGLFRAMTYLIEIYENAAVSAIEVILDSGGANVEVAVEALRRLGGVEHPPTRKYRFAILQKNLLSQSARIRFGAALGLSAMNDSSAIPALEQALQAERYPKLQRTLRDVLRQVEAGGRCPAS